MSWKLDSQLSKITKAVRENSAQALFEVAGDIAVTAAELAPYDEGDLSESYLKPEAIEKVSDFEYNIGSDEIHSIIQEYGGAFTHAQPHLEPAFEANERNVKDKLEEVNKKAAR